MGNWAEIYPGKERRALIWYRRVNNLRSSETSTYGNKRPSRAKRRLPLRYIALSLRAEATRGPHGWLAVCFVAGRVGDPNHRSEMDAPRRKLFSRGNIGDRPEKNEIICCR